ncbi:hypothetical protein JKF63_03729 [Porcisia hertigi]|uniref:Uncharacterized protein n=1 Tax=Porcisia hertigi TaxID=2761500 RepID=A0A836LGX9_9TRYP|nr:hypothetical protein JKF63_03729 [Porcisia hertigi]
MESYETYARLQRLPKGTEFPELVLRCTVVAAIPFRVCEFGDDKVFTVIGSVAPCTSDAGAVAKKTPLRINFYNSWGAAASFLDPGDVILLQGFSILNVPPYASGSRAERLKSDPMPIFVRPIQSKSTLRVLQKGEKGLVMEVSVTPDDLDSFSVRGLPVSDTINHTYARTCWGWEAASH